MLELERLTSGQAKDIYALVRDGRCEAKKYLEELDDAPRDELMATLQRMADTGWAGHGESRIGHLKGVESPASLRNTRRVLACCSSCTANGSLSVRTVGRTRGDPSIVLTYARLRGCAKIV